MRQMLIGFFLSALVLTGPASAQLPPEIMVDKHLIEADQLHAKEDYAGAFKVMEKIIALQKEHNLTLPDEFHFKYARAALSADSIKIAFEAVNKYLSATGREGQFYKEALALLLEAEGTQISAEETCVGKPEGAECWKELANLELPRFGCCCRIPNFCLDATKHRAYRACIQAINSRFTTADSLSRPFRQQHRFGGEIRACVSNL